jgi:glycosyltransferase involved in cell wall biosynthesis
MVSNVQREAFSRERSLYVEISPLLEKRLTGIGRFVARLVEALARLVPLSLFTSGADQEIDVSGLELPEADCDIQAWRRRLLQRQWRCRRFSSLSPSAAVYTNLRPSERLFRKEVGILYDFTTELLPRAHEPRVREDYGNFFGRTSAACDKLLAISYSTKRDAGWLCAKPDSDIVVGYPGPSLCVRQHACRDTQIRRRNIILVVSTLEPRKNARFVVDWFRNTRALDPHWQLWWVGSPAWWVSDDFLRGLCGLGQRGDRRRVRFLGAVSDRRLCALYQQAAFTIYPSLYEGFGFPVLDSLRHGAPVLSGFNSSLQEFGGPGVYYFDPCDPTSLDDACRSLSASGRNPLQREDLVRFSWDTLAQHVVSLCA